MRHYLAFSSIAIKEGLAFRINLFTSLFGGFFRLILLISVWKAIYIGHSRLAGYGKEEILFYMVIATAMSAGGLLSVGSILGDRNDSGDIVIDLTRPVSLPWSYFFSSLGDFGVKFWIKSVPTLLIGLIIIRHIPPIAGSQFIWFLLLFVGGSFLHFWLNLALASFTFRTKSSYGLNILWGSGTAFLTGLIVPISFYPGIFQDIILWTPFPSVAYTPLRVLMGESVVMGGLAEIYQKLFHLPVTGSLVIEQFSWILLVLPMAFRIYQWNERVVEVQGG